MSISALIIPQAFSKGQMSACLVSSEDLMKIYMQSPSSPVSCVHKIPKQSAQMHAGDPG